MKLSFTGTVKGMTVHQAVTVGRLIQLAQPTEGHHGDCTGADVDFHNLMKLHAPQARMIGHPPVDEKLRAFCIFDELRESDEYLKRNRVIVAEGDALIATPSGYKEIPRGSGTWATIRYAREAQLPRLIVWPDGTATEEQDGTRPLL